MSRIDDLLSQMTLDEKISMLAGADLWHSVQVNVDAGRLPAPHANGHRYLVIPLNVLRPASDVGEPLPRKGA